MIDNGYSSMYATFKDDAPNMAAFMNAIIETNAQVLNSRILCVVNKEKNERSVYVGLYLKRSLIRDFEKRSGQTLTYIRG